MSVECLISITLLPGFIIVLDGSPVDCGLEIGPGT